MTEYEGVTCKNRYCSGNSASGVIANCKKQPTCWAVEGRCYCKERTGPFVFTKKDGMVNLDVKEGGKVWIKGKH